jgi:6-phosphogluconolactonase (cycloisomerase 2 family)
LLYIGETVATSGTNTGGLRAFSYGSFQEISGSPFDVNGLAPIWILPYSTGSYVYVLNRQANGSTNGVITELSVTQSNSTVSLTALGNTFTAGVFSQALVEESTGVFLLAVNFGGNPDLTCYTFDSSKPGYLSTTFKVATGNDPVAATAIDATH